jgi:hypothetical protein
MPSSLSALLLLSLAFALACALWSAQAIRHPLSRTVSKSALWVFSALVTFALLRIWSQWAIPFQYSAKWSGLLVVLVAVLVPAATCHLVCQSALQRSASTKVSAALGFASGVVAVAPVLVLAYLASCGVAGECA